MLGWRDTNLGQIAALGGGRMLSDEGREGLWRGEKVEDE